MALPASPRTAVLGTARERTAVLSLAYPNRKPLLRLCLSAGGYVFVAGLLISAAAWWLSGLPGWAMLFALRVALVFSLICVAVFLFLPRHLPLATFGLANGVTLLRAALTALFAGLLGDAAATLEAYGWLLASAGSVALLLDALDGWLARRGGGASEFGARFDMEVDALFMLVLALLLVEAGKLGPWILLAGAARYLFLAAGWLWPPLCRSLPASRRRQAICAIQGACLVACLAPPLGGWQAAAVAGTGLALLLWSFAIDVIWLIQRRHHEGIWEP